MNNQMFLRVLSVIIIVIGIIVFFVLAKEGNVTMAILAVFSSIVFGSLIWGFSIVIDLLQQMLDETIETRRKLEEQRDESQNEEKINVQLPSL